MSGEEKDQSLTAVVDRAIEEPDGDKISLRELIDSQHGQSFGPLLFLLGLVALSPIGTIPGMSIVLGSMIVLIAAQLLCCRSTPWLPGFLLRRSFSRDKLEAMRDKVRPWVRRVSYLVGSRLTLLTRTPAAQVIAAVCIGLAVLFYPLALLPFAVALPAGAITLFGVALTAQDGLLSLLGFILTSLAVWLTVTYWPL